MRVAFIAAAMLMMSPTACPSRALLRLEPAQVADQSVPPVSPQAVRTLMVVPPEGTTQGSDLVAEFERMLLTARVQLVSPGLAAAPAPVNPGQHPAPAVTNLQQAMAAARMANVDAVLQLVELGFQDAYRPFVQVADTFEEVRQGTSVSSSALVRVTEARFVLKARLIDARDGRMLMGVDLSQGTSRVFEPAKDIEMQAWTRREAREINTDNPARREVAKQQVMQACIAKLMHAQMAPSIVPPAPGVAPSPAAPATPPEPATTAAPAATGTAPPAPTTAPSAPPPASNTGRLP